ncbi:MAG: [FeFe] hydrogenase H-cluster radical SAM maturase HydE [Mesoaciditoga sp.]|uniref:[FeFe] hydrogenase H-cluster radical SAM maturase HydE n=1 Tax=Athalassotoga sp. TaxID=2022597 RepID=UPI000CBB3174|nr:MAG: [FeFe] hydrogenase H-cluster radical SAM maturase HydE [Mesoaciditoga sp.]PMP78820.1 MAG: [FeFe] hydrogenase H-cluster radical SAM maturase HydE [Mesoaciditoga sp.]HEU24064.1 [FeFe] hydrogenase H-cluster radical SAM maturase HydE [Mesoaciditoga lauensis]
MLERYSQDSLTFKKVEEILNSNLPDNLKSAASKVIEDRPLSREEIVYLLGLKDSVERKYLFDLASCVRHDNVGDTIFIKGIIEFSNYCKRDCLYCGIRSSNKVPRYRMKEDEIVKTAIEAANYGVDTIILQSGEDPFYTTEIIERIIKKIRETTHRAVSLSIGEREPEEFEIFKKAGASKYLLKQETVNKKIFEMVHGDDYERRIFLIKTLVSLKYITGGGDIIGLPGQTLEDIADDIIFMREAGIKMAGIGPFIPARGTPLENYPTGSAEITLNAYACTRLMIPLIQLPTTTALGTIDKNLQYKAFDAGCNVIMVNFTPDTYRSNYRIYDNKRKVEFYETVRDLSKMNRRLTALVKARSSS